ncbi:protein-histidine kinase [Ceratobasidium sp. AG-Ba]|nr:protein-histidine kinase [Ceratobasidium sp. AG-Ba]
MSVGRDMLSSVPLVVFLDAYPEPAFILCTNTSPHSSLDFVFGNAALHALLFGHDDSGVLNGSSFFAVLSSDDDLLWLSDPLRGRSQHSSIDDSHPISLKPAWLPRDHAPIDLELTPTPIDLPMTMPGVGSSSKSYVFTASPRKTPMNLLRSETYEPTSRRRRDSSLRIPDFPPPPASASVGQRLMSIKSRSKSDSTSWPSQTAPGPQEALLPSRLVHTFPWEKTSLGPREKWPATLKVMVQYLMEKPISSSILWGWPEHVMIYNDAYSKMIGTKHPGIFGQPGAIAWGELWDSLAPVSDLARKGRSTAKIDDQMFFNSLTEAHLPEEVYHSWHWTPIWQEDGTVGGIWNTTFESTTKVIAERRLAGMSDLLSRLSDATTQEQFGERTMEVLARNQLDMPFLALYWCEVENDPATPPRIKKPSGASAYIRNYSSTLVDVKLTLAGTVGIPDGHQITPSTVKYTLDPVTHSVVELGSSGSVAAMDIDGTPRGFTLSSPIGGYAPSIHGTATTATSIASVYDTAPASATSEHQPSPIGATPPSTSSTRLNFASVFVSGSVEIVDPLSSFLAQGLDGRGFKDTPRAAALLPISANSGKSGGGQHGRRLPHAVLLVGLNTRRAYDADYAAWLESVCTGLSNQLTVVLQREADARMIEERERMDKAKTMFFTNVSHELRTPLTLIQAPLEQLAGSGVLTHEAKYKIQLAIRNAKRLKKLIDSIMDMSKLEAGRLIGHFRPVQLGKLTADLAALFRSMAEKKGIAYEISVGSTAGDEPPVYVDVDFWEKIVCNLLSNAFKYTTKGKVSLSVRHDFTMACVRVTDTGVGIPKKYAEQIFERFFRVNNNSAEGTGIGLSLTKELVSLHGGTMSVESQTEDEHPGETGTTFTVTLPHGSAHLPATLVHDSAKPGGNGASHGQMEYWMELDVTTPSVASGDEEDDSVTSSTLFFEKDDAILIVDDNADMRQYIRKIFSPYLTVWEARDGIEALEVVSTQKLNLVLCDVMMPLMDGPEFLTRVREERRNKHLPVIFVTASDDMSLFGGRTEGAVDYVSKPFRVRDLLARVHLQLQLGKRRVKLEEDFEVRSHELRVLADLSPVGIFRTDATGKMTYLNGTWYQITGFPPEQDRDEWLDFVHGESLNGAIQLWRDCFEMHKAGSVQIQWKSERWTHLALSPLTSTDGEMLGAFGAITDTNEQHRAEEARIALAEEREHIAALRAQEAEEQRQMEVERRRAQELLIDVTSHELRQPVSAIIQNAEVVRTNMKGLRELLNDCRKRNICYAPTERMLSEMDDDLQAMDSIMQCGLAQARIANDVLSLSRIQLNVLSIIPTEFDIRRETSQILMVFRNELMTKDIDFNLDLGRGADMFGLQTISTDRSRFAQIITNLMSNAIRFTDMSTGRREIKVSLELALDPPSDETCAPPQLVPGRLPLIRSPASESGDTSAYIYVSVQDSGPGLQKEDLALLFQRFQQGSNAHHVFGGSGLGLFVCRQLCNLMGGKIEVVSELGKGAMFRFFIRGTVPSSSRGPSILVPRVRRSASIHSKASGVSKTSVRSGSRPLPETPNLHLTRPLHVLITEDNKINQTVLARQMKRAGFTYALASNGLEAVNAIERADHGTPGNTSSGKYDVVLMDLEMPVMDGFAATREIRKMEAEGSLQTRSFVIALTGNARLEQVEAARDAGVDDVMIKPYQIESLISKMRAGYQAAKSE